MGEGAHATIPKTKTAANPRRPTTSQPADQTVRFFDFIAVTFMGAKRSNPNSVV